MQKKHRNLQKKNKKKGKLKKNKKKVLIYNDFDVSNSNYSTPFRVLLIRRIK
jgi:hypothetical protein